MVRDRSSMPGTAASRLTRSAMSRHIRGSPPVSRTFRMPHSADKPHHAGDLVKAQNPLAVPQPAIAQGIAVDAPQIAPIRDRDSQVIHIHGAHLKASRTRTGVPRSRLATPISIEINPPASQSADRWAEP